MFREMRRFKQQMTDEEAQAVLERRTDGVLGVIGDDGYPYTVPVNYIYEDGKILFHCARAGHKLDAIRENPKVSFCVIDENMLDRKNFATYYSSVICFGHARVLEEDEERIEACRRFCTKMYPYTDAVEAEIAKHPNAFYMVEIQIDHMTGKHKP